MSTRWVGRLCHHLPVNGVTPFLEEVDGGTWA